VNRAGRRVAIALTVVAAVAIGAVALRLALVPSPRTLRFDVPRVAVAVPADAAAVARGRHLSEAVAVCTVCHGDDLGGRLAFEHPLLGRGYTPNLTAGRGGIGAAYDAADWDRALRHGVDRSGRGLLFMPVDHYQHLSDADLGAMIAYYRSMPPVDNERTGLELTLLARTMIDLGLSGAVVRVAALAVARASDVHAMTLTPQAGAGNYAVRFDARRAGEWELRFDATEGGEHFTQVSRVRLSSRASGSESRDDRR